MPPRRHHRCKPDSNHGNRMHTNQTRGADAMSLLQTSAGVGPADSAHRGRHQCQPIERSERMVLPTTNFYHLLKSVGAKGEPSSCGELFTVKQICFYLKEYIKHKQLYDANNPLLIHCENDPLGKVFSVKSFTFHNALPLVMKNILMVDSHVTRWRDLTPIVTDDTSKMAAVSCASPTADVNINDLGTRSPVLTPSSSHCDDVMSSQDFVNQVTSTTTALTTPRTPRKQFLSHQSETDSDDGATDKPHCSRGSNAVKHLFLESASTTGGEQQDEESGEVIHRLMRHRSRCKSANVDDTIGTINNNHNNNNREKIFGRPNRKRRHTASESISKCSFSRYNHSADELDRCSQSWCFETDLDTDSDETVYSIQSKETVYVKDSSDDLWFLEEDDTSDEIQSVQSGHYLGEYELETDVDSDHNLDHDLTDGSESPSEIVVKCDDSDVQFWADSESENESSDGELTDKWKCVNCGTKNQPLCRHCNRCWSIRPGWLPEPGDHRSSVPSEPPVSWSKADVSSGSRNVQHATTHQRSVEDVHFPLPTTSSNHYPSELCTSADHVDKNIVMDCFLKSQPESFNSAPQSFGLGDMDANHSSHPASTICTSSASVESNTSRELYKVLPAVSSTGDGSSLCSAKGRLLPRLKLPTDDSGNGSMTSSQESVSSLHSSSQDISLSSPLKKPRVISHLDKVPTSPRKCSLSPYKRYSPFPASPFSSKQSLFQFDHQLSPGKRLCQADRHIAGLSSSNVAPPSSISVACVKSPHKSESSRRIFFVDPLPSPKRRAPNGVEYSDLCMICLSKPKEASIIHGKTGHQVCCYLCAKRLRRTGKPCPVCRRHIQKVVKNYLV